jgi:hypothetical protein
VFESRCPDQPSADDTLPVKGIRSAARFLQWLVCKILDSATPLRFGRSAYGQGDSAAAAKANNISNLGLKALTGTAHAAAGTRFKSAR